MRGGKMRKNKIILIALLLLILPVKMAWAAATSDWVAILISDNEPVYTLQAAAFSNAYNQQTRKFNMQGVMGNTTALRQRLESNKPPALIFALGAKAAYAARLITTNHQHIPVIFAMALNWQRYGLLDDRENMSGISTDLDPGSQFLNLQIFAPDVKKIGVIYNPDHSGALVAKARLAADMFGFQLIERPIKSGQLFQRTYRQMAGQVDGFWILNEPGTFTVDNMSWMQEKCLADKLVCIGHTRNAIENGLLLSVQPDMTHIGVQAASMTDNILKRGQRPADIGVMKPLGTVIIVNRTTARQIGRVLTAESLNMATEVVE